MQRGDAITPLATWVIHGCSIVQKEAHNLWRGGTMNSAPSTIHTCLLTHMSALRLA